MTYSFYHEYVKPKPENTSVKGWRCVVCINLFDYISAEDIEVDDKHDTIEISLFMHEYVKPKPENTSVKGWRCVVCGYVYEGEELPPDFVCPW